MSPTSCVSELNDLALNSVFVIIQCESTPLGFYDIFPKWFGIFSPNFTRLLHVPTDARLLITIQIAATFTKLCHIKHYHPVHIICSKCPPSAGTHAGWSHLIWHNFVTVGDN